MPLDAPSMTIATVGSAIVIGLFKEQIRSGWRVFRSKKNGNGPPPDRRKDDTPESILQRAKLDECTEQTHAIVTEMAHSTVLTSSAIDRLTEGIGKTNDSIQKSHEYLIAMSAKADADRAAGRV